MSTDLLAVFAHPDDAELLCGGTIAVSVDLGYGREGSEELARGVGVGGGDQYRVGPIVDRPSSIVQRR